MLDPSSEPAPELLLERLVLLAPDLLSPDSSPPTSAQATDIQAVLQKHCRIVSAMPPRLLVVLAGESAAERLRGLDGVDRVISASDEISDEILPGSLSEAERVFALAWQQRCLSDQKVRSGDGLNWAADGFSAPDWPDPAAH